MRCSTTELQRRVVQNHYNRGLSKRQEDTAYLSKGPPLLAFPQRLKSKGLADWCFDPIEASEVNNSHHFLSDDLNISIPLFFN